MFLTIVVRNDFLRRIRRLSADLHIRTVLPGNRYDAGRLNAGCARWVRIVYGPCPRVPDSAAVFSASPLLSCPSIGQTSVVVPVKMVAAPRKRADALLARGTVTYPCLSRTPRKTGGKTNNGNPFGAVSSPLGGRARGFRVGRVTSRPNGGRQTGNTAHGANAVDRIFEIYVNITSYTVIPVNRPSCFCTGVPPQLLFPNDVQWRSEGMAECALQARKIGL